MSKQSSLWQPLGEDMPIVSTALPLKIALLPAAYGQLRLQCRNGVFPEGELLLIVSNWPQTSHWYLPAVVKDGVLEAYLSGVEVAYTPDDNRPLLIWLARRTDSGLEQFLFTAPVSAARFSPATRCLYFFDDRDLWGGPVASFCQNEVLYEAVPRYVKKEKKSIFLGLSLLPRCMRFWDQVSYGLTSIAVKRRRLFLTATSPEGAPELVGFALYHFCEGRPEERFFPGKVLDGACHGEINMDELPLEGGEWTLAGVLAGEDEIHYYVPLSIISARIHQVLELVANGTPLRMEEGRGCYLQVDDLCRLTLQAGCKPPVCQTGIQAGTLRQALERELLPVVGHCAIRNLGGQNWHWRLELPGYELGPEDEIVLRAEYGGECYDLPVEVLSCTMGRSLLSIDFSSLAGGLQNSLTINWSLSLAIRKGTDFYRMQLRLPLQTIRKRLDTDTRFLDYSFAYNAPIGDVPLGEQLVEALICCPRDGYCQLQTGDQLRRYERQMVCRAVQAELRGGHLKLKVCCPNTAPGTWTSFALVHRYRLEADRQVYFCPADQVRRREDGTWLIADVDLTQFHFSPLYWDIRAVFEGEDGIARIVRIRLNRQKKQRMRWIKRLLRRVKQAERLFYSNSYRQGQDMAVSLYETANGQLALVCQEYSPYSGMMFRLKERLAIIIYKLFRKRLTQKHIFLCYEKYCCMAQDNGFYFFRHCMENDMERKMKRSIYFVIDKKQPDYQERLLPYQDHVIQFMSLKHMVYLLAARLLISSDSKAHAYAWRAKESVILPRVLNGKRLVFLQHGVIALKRVGFYSKGTNAVNLFVTSNQREHDIIVEEMAYPPEDVIITGLARWDVLEDRGLKERHVLVMPTWRNWLEEVSDLAFMTSDYYRNYMSLLNDARLAKLLEEQDLYLDFYIHPKFRDYLADFSISNGDRVRMIAFGSEPLNQLIMGCKLLITDYSSVCWDVYYQGKPVLFYQFDVDRYNETTGAYIDLETELFGDRVMTVEELLEQLELYAKQDFRLPERYAELRPKMYAYLDHNNSQRICEEIMKRNW